MGDLGNILAGLSVWAIPILLAITLHEAGHGYVAYLFGDSTAKNQGRLTLNPIAHIDPFGTVLLPLLLFFTAGFVFGYAKPVPVDSSKFKNPRRDMIWVALAGPGANIFLAVMGALLIPLALKMPDTGANFFVQNLANLMFINCLLAVFNLLPIPPLDGGRVAVGLLPWRMAIKYAQLERYGIFIVVGLIMILPMLGRVIGLDLNIARVLILEPTFFLYNLIASLFGLV